VLSRKRESGVFYCGGDDCKTRLYFSYILEREEGRKGVGRELLSISVCDSGHVWTCNIREGSRGVRGGMRRYVELSDIVQRETCIERMESRESVSRVLSKVYVASGFSLPTSAISTRVRLTIIKYTPYI
jgi:hypothetical protein